MYVDEDENPRLIDRCIVLFIFSLRSCGINYSDPYALEFPRYSKSNVDFNQFLHQFKDFHAAPFIKFWYCAVRINMPFKSMIEKVLNTFQITYFVFLLLFSYVLLFNFNQPSDKIPSIHSTEIAIIIFVSFILFEEIRYVHI